MNFRFPKNERLKSKKLIQKIFAERQVVKSYPVLAFYTESLLSQEVSGIQVGFSVSKKKFKKAATRNLLKRRMREAYRLNRNEFPFPESNDGTGLGVLFVFVKNEAADFEEINRSVRKILKTLTQKTMDKRRQSPSS